MCQCVSCRNTDALAGFKWETVDGERKRVPDEKGGFANWPRGKPAGRKAATEYAAHVAYLNRGGINRAIPAFSTDPVSFYGVGASSRAEVLAVLKRTFQCE